MKKNNVEVQKFFNKINTDSEFKENLISDPVATIDTYTGKKLREGYSIVVEDQSDSNVVFLNIPPNPASGEELTFEELENIVGGNLFYDLGHAIGGWVSSWDGVYGDYNSSGYGNSYYP